MNNRAAKILLIYAALLVALGAALAVATGFHDGWRLVGMNVAIACAFAAALCQLGSTRRIAAVRRLGKLAGLVVTFAAAINFGRLAFKWHRSELGVPIDAAVAAVMAVAGFIAAVLLWRTMRDAFAATWAQRVRQLAGVTGMAAMLGGLVMIKFASTPQAATAVATSTRAVEDMMLSAADSAVGERVIDAALDNDRVLEALERRGVTADQARRLADDPELRAAALELLRGSNVAIPADGPAAQPPSPGGPATSVARNDRPIRITADELLAHFSKDELRELARTYNGSLQNVDISALNGIDPAGLEPYLEDPNVRRALDRLGVSPQEVRRVPDNPTSTQIQPATRSADARLPAVRVRPARHDDRSETARVDTRAAVDPRVMNLDDQSDAAAAPIPGGAHDSAPYRTGPELFAQRALLDRADPVQQRMLNGSVDAPLDRAPVAATPHDAPDAPDSIAASGAQATLDDARRLAEVIRAEVLGDRRAGALPIPETQSWTADPGLFLTRTGTIALVIGAAVLLCAIAAGSRRTSPQSAM